MREEVPNIEEGGADLLAHLVIYTAERRVNVNRFRSAQPTAAPARTNHVRVCNSTLPSRPAPGSRRASAPILRRGALAPPCFLKVEADHKTRVRPVEVHLKNSLGRCAAVKVPPKFAAVKVSNFLRYKHLKLYLY